MTTTFIPYEFPDIKEPDLTDPETIPSIPLFVSISAGNDVWELDNFPITSVRTLSPGQQRVQLVAVSWVREDDLVYEYVVETPPPLNGFSAVMRQRELTTNEKIWLRKLGVRK